MRDVTKETQYGTAEKSNSDSTGIPVLRMNNITYGGEIDLAQTLSGANFKSRRTRTVAP